MDLGRYCTETLLANTNYGICRLIEATLPNPQDRCLMPIEFPLRTQAKQSVAANNC